MIRLLVVDDHDLVREGFVSLLNRQPDFLVVGEAADGEEAIQKAGELRPDVVLMDVDMPTMDGMEATRRITERHADIVVIGLSLHENKNTARVMTEAGADAYVSKNAAAKDLVRSDGRPISVLSAVPAVAPRHCSVPIKGRTVSIRKWTRCCVLPS